MAPLSKQARWGLAGLLLVATFVIYAPSMRGDFLWDDDAYISHNAELTNVPGLRRIWLAPGSTQQYYPLTFTAFWAEYHLWGLNTTGYHAVNVLVHSANALLLGLVLSLLGLPGAWIAACLFALHPIQAESVAWMTELKNVLSTFFYLLTLLCLLKSNLFLSSSPAVTGRGPTDFSHKHSRLMPILALLFYLCALLSKSVTVTLPVSVLLVSAWSTGRLDKQRLWRMLPFLALAAGVGLYTLHYEHRLVGAQGLPWTFTVAERLIIAGRAFWFYLMKLTYPSPLVFVYPRWSIQPQNPLSYLYPATAVLFLWGAAYGRRWWGKLPFAGLLFFLLSLLPTLGLTSFYYMRYSFVADHFQYLASMGILTLAGWLLALSLTRLTVPASSPAGLVVIGLISLNLGLGTFRASRKYADSLRLWQETLMFNPDSAIAHHNAGIAFSERGQWKDAIAHLRAAEALDPSFSQTHLALAYFAARAQRWEDARHQYEEAFRLGENDPQVLKDYAALPPGPPHPRANHLP